MATLSAGNLVSLRTQIQRASPRLSILRPVVLLDGLVNNAAIARGARTIAFDNGSGGGFATIEAGQTLIVTTSDGLQRVRVKEITGSQSSGSIVVAENSINWADNQAFSIYHNYEIWPIPLTIRGGVFFKDYSIAYSDQNATPNPIALIGSHRVGTLSAGTVAFALNSSSSYAIANGASISSRVWSCAHNGGGTTGISFSSTTTANPTLTITEPDTYWLKCVVTDSNGKTQATYRALFVYDEFTPPYIDFTISGLSGDWQTGGYRFNIEATGDIALGDFPDRTLVVLWYDNTFNGATGYVDLWGTASQNIICCGYLRRDQDNDDFSPDGTGRASFEVTTADGILDATAILGSVSLEAVTSPSKWYEYASWLTVGRSVHHLLKWHSTVLECVDVYGLTSNTLGVKDTPYTEASLLQMINSFSWQRGHFAKMVSDRLGRLHFVTDSQMLGDAARAALDTVFSITEADISGVVDVVRQEEEQVTITDLDGFSFSFPTSTPFISMQPGYRESSVSYNMPEMRGAGGASWKSQVLIDQTDANEKVGRAHAKENRNPFEIRHSTPSNYLGAFDIVPSIGWYNWNIADADLKRNTALNGLLLICRHVDHAIDHTAGTIQTSVVFEPEAQGPSGIQGNYPVSYPVTVLRVPSWNNPNAYAYWAGGSDVSSVIVAIADRIAIASGVTSAHTPANLSAARTGAGAVSSTSTYAYFSGGVDGTTTYLTTGDRLNLGTGVMAAFANADLSLARGGCGGISSGATYGYFGGGRDVLSAYATSDRLLFSTGVTAANAGSNLSSARHSQGVASSGGTYGYWSGGSSNVLTSGQVVTADRITFSTSVTAANAGSNLTIARYELGGISDGASFGYFLGGAAGGPIYYNTADRITFSSGVTAANAGSNLSLARATNAGLSDGGSYGYAAGGYNGSGISAVADRLVFSSGAMAANPVSNLSAVRAIWNNGGVSSGV